MSDYSIAYKNLSCCYDDTNCCYSCNDAVDVRAMAASLYTNIIAKHRAQLAAVGVGVSIYKYNVMRDGSCCGGTKVQYDGFKFEALVMAAPDMVRGTGACDATPRPPRTKFNV